MTWLIIALILVAAFGPVFWLKPSKRDKQLTALRERARQLGLLVDMKPLTALRVSAQERVSAGGQVRNTARLSARYGFTLDRSLRHISPWRLLRGTPEASGQDAHERPSIAVIDHWRFDPELDFPPQQAWPRSVQVLQPELDALPEGVLGVELEGRMIAVYWSEKGDFIDEIAETLRVWGTRLVSMDQQEHVTTEDGDS